MITDADIKTILDNALKAATDAAAVLGAAADASQKTFVSDMAEQLRAAYDKDQDKYNQIVAKLAEHLLDDAKITDQDLAVLFTGVEFPGIVAETVGSMIAQGAAALTPREKYLFKFSSNLAYQAMLAAFDDSSATAVQGNAYVQQSFNDTAIRLLAQGSKEVKDLSEQDKNLLAKLPNALATEVAEKVTHEHLLLLTNERVLNALLSIMAKKKIALEPNHATVLEKHPDIAQKAAIAAIENPDSALNSDVTVRAVIKKYDEPLNTMLEGIAADSKIPAESTALLASDPLFCVLAATVAFENPDVDLQAHLVNNESIAKYIANQMVVQTGDQDLPVGLELLLNDKANAELVNTVVYAVMANQTGVPAVALAKLPAVRARLKETIKDAMTNGESLFEDFPALSKLLELEGQEDLVEHVADLVLQLAHGGTTISADILNHPAVQAKLIDKIANVKAPNALPLGSAELLGQGGLELTGEVVEACRSGAALYEWKEFKDYLAPMAKPYLDVKTLAELDPELAAQLNNFSPIVAKLIAAGVTHEQTFLTELSTVQACIVEDMLAEKAANLDARHTELLNEVDANKDLITAAIVALIKNPAHKALRDNTTLKTSLANQKKFPPLVIAAIQKNANAVGATEEKGLNENPILVTLLVDDVLNAAVKHDDAEIVALLKHPKMEAELIAIMTSEAVQSAKKLSKTQQALLDAKDHAELVNAAVNAVINNPAGTTVLGTAPDVKAGLIAHIEAEIQASNEPSKEIKKLLSLPGYADVADAVADVCFTEHAAVDSGYVTLPAIQARLVAKMAAEKANTLPTGAPELLAKTQNGLARAAAKAATRETTSLLAEQPVKEAYAEVLARCGAGSLVPADPKDVEHLLANVKNLAETAVLAADGRSTALMALDSARAKFLELVVVKAKAGNPLTRDQRAILANPANIKLLQEAVDEIRKATNATASSLINDKSVREQFAAQLVVKGNTTPLTKEEQNLLANLPQNNLLKEAAVDAALKNSKATNLIAEKSVTNGLIQRMTNLEEKPLSTEMDALLAEAPNAKMVEEAAKVVLAQSAANNLKAISLVKNKDITKKLIDDMVAGGAKLSAEHSAILDNEKVSEHLVKAAVAALTNVSTGLLSHEKVRKAFAKLIVTTNPLTALQIALLAADAKLAAEVGSLTTPSNPIGLSDPSVRLHFRTEMTKAGNDPEKLNKEHLALLETNEGVELAKELAAAADHATLAFLAPKAVRKELVDGMAAKGALDPREEKLIHDSPALKKEAAAKMTATTMGYLANADLREEFAKGVIEQGKAPTATQIAVLGSSPNIVEAVSIHVQAIPVAEKAKLDALSDLFKVPQVEAKLVADLAMKPNLDPIDTAILTAAGSNTLVAAARTVAPDDTTALGREIGFADNITAARDALASIGLASGVKVDPVAHTATMQFGGGSKLTVDVTGAKTQAQVVAKVTEAKRKRF